MNVLATFTRADVEREAQTWVDVPFVHQGRSRLGVDCAGLIRVVGERFVGPMRDRADYPARILIPELLEYLSSQATQISSPRLACVMLFWFKKKVGPQHAAWKSTKGMLHAYGTGKKVTDNYFTPAWQNRLHSCWDLPGILD